MHAQKLFEPKEFSQAVQNETRTRSGKPGTAYWQNKADYFIRASYNPEDAMISGNVSIIYINNSTDTLKRIYLKLMQNVYAKGSPRAWEVNADNLHSGVEISNLHIDSFTIAQENIQIKSTLMHFDTERPIAPGETVSIQMDFKTPMQKQIKYRSGALDSTTIFAGYWFPQLCVYDDIFGWDKVQYMLNTENYNEFSNYLVELTLPSNFVVWATGRQLNPEETFQKVVLKRIAKSKKSTEPITIISKEDYINKKVLRDGDSLVWKFEAKHMSDFAWGASTHFIWEAASAMNPDDKNLCWVQSAYPVTNRKNDNANVLRYALQSVEHFSQVFPAVAYPYASHITFIGGTRGGMEFPMIANNSSMDSTFANVATAHEIAHNYFPFYMGVNERKFGWFDEMITTQMENSFIKQHFPKIYKRSLRSDKYYAGRYNGTFGDLPLMVESNQIITQTTMLNNFYMKSNEMVNALKSLIGEPNLAIYIQDFMKTWAGKHPTPYDFFYFVNHKSLVNLNWFWNRWAFQFGSVDLAITASQQNANQYHISNEGGRPVPFKIEMKLQDGSMYEEVYNAGIWEKSDNLTFDIPKDKIPEQIAIRVTQDIFETSTANNTLEIDVSEQAEEDN